MQDVWLWIKQNATELGAFGTAVSAFGAVIAALATVALAFYTVRLVSLTKILARETRLTREASERADIQCSVEPYEEQPSVIELVIANLGRSVARDVRIHVDPIEPNNIIGSGAAALSFATLLPGVRVRQLLTLAARKEQVIKAAIGYDDNLGHHELCFEQAMSGWFDYNGISNRAIYKSASALDKIASVLESWQRGRRLNVDIFGRVDREHESKNYLRPASDIGSKKT